MTAAKKLICGHLFHVHCLRSWLERQNTCPTCRALVITPENRTSATATRTNGHPQGMMFCMWVLILKSLDARGTLEPKSLISLLLMYFFWIFVSFCLYQIALSLIICNLEVDFILWLLLHNGNLLVILFQVHLANTVLGQELAQLVHLRKDLEVMVWHMIMPVSNRLDSKQLLLLLRYMRNLLFIPLQML